MSGLTLNLIVWATFGPCRAPVPLAPAEDPLAKAAIGIGTQQGDSLFVGNVYPDMPAGKAGVRAGDQIVRVGTFRPAGFQDMVNHVKAYRPGAVVEVEVDRAGERKVFKLKLVARPPSFDNPVMRNVELLPVLPGGPPPQFP